MSRSLVVTGALLGFTAVGLGAFGAHALEGRLTERALHGWEVGVRYQLAHALALLLLAALEGRVASSRLRACGWLFAAGVLLFSGSLYLLALTGWRLLGPVTPLGGLCLLAGWLLLAWSAWRGRGNGDLPQA